MGTGELEVAGARPNAAAEGLLGQNLNIDAVLSQGKAWLLSSGIRYADPEQPLLYGGFGAWYDGEADKYPFIYSETTGYMIQILLWLNALTPDPKLVECACSAADWLNRTVHERTGGYQCLYPLDATPFDYKKDQMYAFDNGIILNGMTNLYRATNRPEYLAAAISSADWLIYSAQKEDGSFYPIYQLSDEKFFESDKEWSTCSGSYHAKIGIGLLNLYDVTAKNKYKESAQRLLRFAAKCQLADGRFVSFLSRGGTNAHPHCYSAEAMWVAGKFLGEKDYLKSSAAAVKWLLDHQNAEGLPPRLFIQGKPTYNERVDALSQTLRLGLLARENGCLLDDESKTRLMKIVALVSASQSGDENQRMRGGFYFGRKSDGTRLPHVNSWVTSFALQALSLLRPENLNLLAKTPFMMI